VEESCPSMKKKYCVKNFGTENSLIYSPFLKFFRMFFFNTPLPPPQIILFDKQLLYRWGKVYDDDHKNYYLYLHRKEYIYNYV
jgi:hypothetical protein